jgi:putative spermidine/putrescine transport system ATP-binding protein
VGFGAGPGLEGVSLAVAPGERVAVVGASGAGKTTLLRAVAGLAPVRAGRVLVARAGAPARDVTRLPPERRDAVYLHQTPTPFAHLSVWENVAFPLRLRGVRGAALAREVDAALALVRLEALGARMPHALSGGQRHRMTLARAIVARPAVLLLDEPLSSLDPALREGVRAAIVRAQEAYGPAMLLVTHDLDEAGLVAHRVAVLAERRLVQVAAPAELFARPATLAVARLLGTGAEVPGEAAGGRFACVLGVWAAAVAPGPAVAVVRPDALRLAPAGAGAGRPGTDGAPDAVPGVVTAHRHRARQTTAAVRLAGDVAVEVAAAPGALPAVGDGVRVALVDPGLVPVFAAPPAPAAG